MLFQLFCFAAVLQAVQMTTYTASTVDDCPGGAATCTSFGTTAWNSPFNIRNNLNNDAIFTQQSPTRNNQGTWLVGRNLRAETTPVPTYGNATVQGAVVNVRVMSLSATSYIPAGGVALVSPSGQVLTHDEPVPSTNIPLVTGVWLNLPFKNVALTPITSHTWRVGSVFDIRTVDFDRPNFGMAIRFEDSSNGGQEVRVTSLTLDLYWDFFIPGAPGGTTAAPNLNSGGTDFSLVGIIIGAIVGAAVVVGLVILIVYLVRRRRLQAPEINLEAPLASDYQKF